MIDEYNILGYRHNYTKSGEYIISGMFIPAFTCVMGDMMDERGVCDSARTIQHYVNIRKAKETDPEGYIQYCAEYCFTPEEALSRKGDNIFNAKLLTDQLNYVIQNKIASKIRRGTVYYKNLNPDKDEKFKEIVFQDSINGKILMIEPPVTHDDSGNKLKNLYVAGIDGIDFGLNDSSGQKDVSEYCLVIKKRAYGTDEGGKYVCIYKERPDRIEKAYETTILLLEWYNARAVLENSRLGILKYMQSKKKQHLLFQGIASTMSTGSKSKQFGVTPNEKNILRYLELISEYVNDNCQNILFPDMLNELITYSYVNKRKFDIVASLGMCELGDEELGASSSMAQAIRQSKLRQFGYYYDENGNKRYGVIPSKEELVPIPEDLKRFIK